MPSHDRFFLGMKISIITLFPDFFTSPLAVSVVSRAARAGLLTIELVDLRSFGRGAHRQVDDSPCGGGPGMVTKDGGRPSHENTLLTKKGRLREGGPTVL